MNALPAYWSADWIGPPDPLSVGLAWFAFLVFALMLGDYLRSLCACMRDRVQRWFDEL